MRRKAPIVQRYMSRLPAEMEDTDFIDDAVRLMRDGGIRHIPVMQGARLHGVVSRHDTDAAFALHGPGAAGMTVGEICSRELLTVSPLTPITEVTRSMLDRKVGSALVVDGGVLVGIFTSSDALRALDDAY